MSRILITLLLGLLGLNAMADEPSEPLLRVGLSEVPPFVIKEPDGSWRGISIDLWQQVAAQSGLRYELQPMPFERLLPSLEQGQLDVVVGALTMTAEREARFDFTHPFYRTGLAIGVPRGGEGSGWATVKGLLSWQVRQSDPRPGGPVAAGRRAGLAVRAAAQPGAVRRLPRRKGLAPASGGRR